MSWRVKSGVHYFSQKEHYHIPLICLETETSDYKISIGGRETFLRGLESLNLSVRTLQPGLASANDRFRSVQICFVVVSPLQPLPTHNRWAV